MEYNSALFYLPRFVHKLTFFLTAVLVFSLTLTACTPKFDWRQSRVGDAPGTILMPGKPAQLSREIRIGQQTVTMQMSAARIDSIKFAIGAARMPNATEAQASIAVIKNSLLQNISGQITHDKSGVTNEAGIVTFNDQFEANGSNPGLRMVGRLVARDAWVYQVLVVGPGVAMDRAADREAAENFLSSFKPV